MRQNRSIRVSGKYYERFAASNFAETKALRNNRKTCPQALSQSNGIVPVNFFGADANGWFASITQPIRRRGGSSHRRGRVGAPVEQSKITPVGFVHRTTSFSRLDSQCLDEVEVVPASNSTPRC